MKRAKQDHQMNVIIREYSVVGFRYQFLSQSAIKMRKMWKGYNCLHTNSTHLQNILGTAIFQKDKLQLNILCLIIAKRYHSFDTS